MNKVKQTCYGVQQKMVSAPFVTATWTVIGVWYNLIDSIILLRSMCLIWGKCKSNMQFCVALWPLWTSQKIKRWLVFTRSPAFLSFAICLTTPAMSCVAVAKACSTDVMRCRDSSICWSKLQGHNTPAPTNHLACNYLIVHRVAVSRKCSCHAVISGCMPDRDNFTSHPLVCVCGHCVSVSIFLSRAYTIVAAEGGIISLGRALAIFTAM